MTDEMTEELVDDADIDPDDASVDDLEELDDEDVDVDVEEDDLLEEGDAAESGEDEENLDDLEAEELEMLTEDEASESIAVDEAAELRKLRREAAEMDVDPEQATSDEFVCQSCFLVKRSNQLADRRRRICRDCAD